MPIFEKITNHEIAVAAGEVAGKTLIKKFGSNAAVGTSWEVVSSSGLYPTPTAATALEIVSSDNTNDVPAGTGARKVRVYGIKDWSVGEESEEIALNGTTAQALANSWLRVYRMKVIESGSYASATTPSHNSTITLRESTGGPTWATIVPVNSFGVGQSEIAAFSIGSNKQAWVQEIHIDVNSSKTADIIFFIRENADDTSSPYSGVMQAKELLYSVEGDLHIPHDYPLGPYTGPCDMGFMAESTSTSSAVEISFDIIVEDI